MQIRLKGLAGLGETGKHCDPSGRGRLQPGHRGNNVPWPSGKSGSGPHGSDPKLYQEAEFQMKWLNI